jgi:hypothetical protein
VNENCEIVVIKIQKGADGLFTATSSDLTGVCVVHRDKDRIIEDIPNIVRLWYRRHRGIEIEPFRGAQKDYDDISAFPVFPMPAQIAAQALER